jgi:hypothetical protein
MVALVPVGAREMALQLLQHGETSVVAPLSWTV